MRASQGITPVNATICGSQKAAWPLGSGQKRYLDTWGEKAQGQLLIQCQIFKDSREKLKVKQHNLPLTFKNSGGKRKITRKLGLCPFPSSQMPFLRAWGQSHS